MENVKNCIPLSAPRLLTFTCEVIPRGMLERKTIRPDCESAVIEPYNNLFLETIIANILTHFHVVNLPLFGTSTQSPCSIFLFFLFFRYQSENMLKVPIDMCAAAPEHKGAIIMGIGLVVVIVSSERHNETAARKLICSFVCKLKSRSYLPATF